MFHLLKPHAYMLNLQVYPEGTHFLIPWFERPIIYDVRARPHLVESTLWSRDFQKDFSREMRGILTEIALSNFDIVLDDVSITSLTFEEFTERAKFVVEKAEQDKRSAVIRAQGEAKSAQLLGQALLEQTSGGKSTESGSKSAQLMGRALLEQTSGGKSTESGSKRA
ncbi:hypothetical protein U1Q18_038293 [Sarracenia purpurea var. burkii]